ncbi:MAG: hypothetical protein NW205_02365 [Hyphomicrobiaceae bacterium]|nr:hypothetical protein [Hyphomicrobiaceae bacterium]
MSNFASRTAVRFACLSSAVAVLLIAAPAMALEPKPDEGEKLKACEQNLCGIILSKDAGGGDLACQISKTWAKDKIEKGAGEKKLSWGFGDARCGIDLTAERAGIIKALTEKEHSLEMKPQTVKCEVEQAEGATTIDVTLAPKVTFKDGKAHKAWLNISKIEAPTVVKGAIWTVAKIEDNFGVFHGEIIEEINDFVGSKCAKRYPELVKK